VLIDYIDKTGEVLGARSGVDNPLSTARRANVTGDIEALRGATIPSALLKLLQIQPRYHLRQLLIGDAKPRIDRPAS
jgi:hypothetical protein